MKAFDPVTRTLPPPTVTRSTGAVLANPMFPEEVMTARSAFLVLNTIFCVALSVLLPFTSIADTFAVTGPDFKMRSVKDASVPKSFA